MPNISPKRIIESPLSSCHFLIKSSNSKWCQWNFDFDFFKSLSFSEFEFSIISQKLHPWSGTQKQLGWTCNSVHDRWGGVFFKIHVLSILTRQYPEARHGQSNRCGPFLTSFVPFYEIMISDRKHHGCFKFFFLSA